MPKNNGTRTGSGRGAGKPHSTLKPGRLSERHTDTEGDEILMRPIGGGARLKIHAEIPVTYEIANLKAQGSVFLEP